MKDRCKNGHDLTLPGAVYTHAGSDGRPRQLCAECKRERSRVQDRRRREKLRGGRPRPQHVAPSTFGVQLAHDLLELQLRLEVAMPWDRSGIQERMEQLMRTAP